MNSSWGAGGGWRDDSASNGSKRETLTVRVAEGSIVPALNVLKQTSVTMR
jgi:hypothetical protein